MTDFTPDPQIVREFLDGMAARTADTVTVTTVRKALIAESYQHLGAITRLKDKHRGGDKLTANELDLIDVHAKVNAYSYFLAGLLRIIDETHGAEEAAHVASLIDTVRDVGTEVLEFANDDIDERAQAVAS